LNSKNLPTGSYDDILISCGDKVNKCDNSENGLNCTCNNLVGGTEYKIKFITRKKFGLEWVDAIFENIAKQYTGKIYFSYNLNKIGYLIILFII